MHHMAAYKGESERSQWERHIRGEILIRTRLCSPASQSNNPWKQSGEYRRNLPGCRSKSGDPRLEDSHEEREGVFFDYDKIYQRQKDATVDDQAHDHGDHIQPQLPCNHLQVGDGDDLSADEAGNTKRGVPAHKYKVVFIDEH